MVEVPYFMFSDDIITKSDITLEYNLPTLNEYIKAERGNRFAAAKLKKTFTESVSWQVKKLPVIDYPFVMLTVWVMPNQRTDPDNIAYSKKYILDGLKSAGKIQNDNFDFVKGFIDVFKVDKANPCIKLSFLKR